MTEMLEGRTLLSAQWPGVVVGVTPGASAVGASYGPIIDSDGGGVVIRDNGVLHAITAAKSSGVSVASTDVRPTAGFDIVLEKGPDLQSNADASAAFDQAAAFFESIFHDPITVVIDADVRNLGANNVLGQTSSETFTRSFDDIRDHLASDADPTDDAVARQVPTEATLQNLLPDGSFSVAGMSATRANLLAMGFLPSQLNGGSSSDYAPGVKRDASITFNSNYPFDYDRSDGIAPGKSDFVGVAIHEIGHALGFMSAVDNVDAAMSGFGSRLIAPMPLDLFRLAAGAGVSDFAGGTRILAPGTVGGADSPVLYDGGVFDSSRITQISGLTRGDVPMSTGVSFGDGKQASHFKDDSFMGGPANTIGIMDPTAPNGEMRWTAADQRAFSLIGWDVTPQAVPTTIAGVVYSDVNGNGSRDGDESGLPGVTVYDDANNNGTLDATATTFTSSDVPKNVPDPGTATSTLNVSGFSGILRDVDVNLSIVHSYDSDLTVTLISPNNTRVTLFDGIGDDGHNFTNTTLDDAASTPIGASNPPFTGRFSPVGNLSSLEGENPNGQWRLEVVDGAEEDSGTVTGWSITLRSGEESAVTDASGQYSLTVAPGTHNVRQVLGANYTQTEPAGGGARTVTVADGEAATGVDFGAQRAAGAGISGSVYDDANANAHRDAGEGGMVGITVYQDLNNNGVFDPGVINRFAPATQLPVLIPDPGVATSRIVIDDLPAGAVVQDVNVSVDITHPYTPDLRVSLISPTGRRVVLFEWFDEPAFDNNDISVAEFDDEAPVPIDQGTNPFNAAYRPLQPLSLMDGETIDGTWTLEVRDLESQDQGFLNDWWLSFDLGNGEPFVVTDINGDYQFTDVDPGTYRIRQVVPQGFNQTEPAGNGAHVVTVAQGQQVTGRNFGNGTGGPPPASVAGRHVFYNRSRFDGNTAGADAQDDAAVATDKQALMPGQTATFANYTSYTRGINGLMVDIANLPAGGALSPADFAFKVGNSSTPSTWADAPAPTSVTVRRGAGDNGSDRVTLLWADGAIKNQWLQVTALASANTGLGQPDVFYFGNQIGETGNSAANATVNAIDLAQVRSNQLTSNLPLTNRFDVNRDGTVNAVDLGQVRANQLKSINLIGPPAASLVAAPPVKKQDGLWSEEAVSALLN